MNIVTFDYDQITTGNNSQAGRITTIAPEIVLAFSEQAFSAEVNNQFLIVADNRILVIDSRGLSLIPCQK